MARLYIGEWQALTAQVSMGIALPKVSVFTVFKSGELIIYINRCPHLGIPLEFQEHRFLDSSESLIQCSTHGALFETNTGLCVSGPCTGETLHKLEHDVENGKIYVHI